MTTLIRTLIVLLLLSAVAPAGGTTSASPELVLMGVVADGAGRPVPGAHVILQSDRRITATTDRDGGFRVRTMLPSTEHLRAAPCTLQVFVTAHKLRMVTPHGDASITLALSIESTPDHGDRAVARANDERIAAIAAGLVAAGRGTALADSVKFLALDGERVGDPPLAKMPHMAQAPLAMTIAEPVAARHDTVQLPPGVIVEKPLSPMPTGLDLATRPAAPVAAPKTPAQTPARATATDEAAAVGAAKTTASPAPAATGKAVAPTGTSAAKTPSSTGAKSSADPPAKAAARTGGGKGSKATPVTVIVHDGESVQPRPATTAPAGGCSCRIKGTVELMMDPPPTEPVGVAVWAEDAPTIRDSVVIALGPPRPFELLGLPCGSHHLLVRSSSRHPYVIAEPRDMTLPCSAGLLLQPRIVLRPR